MRTLALIACVVANFVALDHAVQLIDGASPAVLGLNIHRSATQSSFKRSRLRRRDPVSATLDNEETLYFANVSLGSPGQKVRLHIDTGSSDTWVNTDSSQLCRAPQGFCSYAGGTYSANASTTSEYLSSNFKVSYVDGSGASGDYVKDSIAIGGQSLTGLQMGVAYKSDSPEGILGIGYAANEAQVNLNSEKPYANLPQLMVERGVIQSNAYSLWLDDLQSSTGSILFGGVDTDKYHGQLESLPTQKEGNVNAEFIITLTNISLSGSSQNNSMDSGGLPAAVLLDSGSSLTFLPDDTASSIFTALGVQYDQSQGLGEIDCNAANDDKKVNFVFTSITISVPLSELVIDSSSDDEDRSGDLFSQQRSCVFGINPAGSSTPVLGDTFLRSAYVVYDLSNNEISLAQTNFNSTTSHVVAIGSGRGSVPDATAVSNPVQAAATQSGGARIALPTSSSLSSTSGARDLQAPFAFTALMVGIVSILASARQWL